jgi:hypothetical protein
MLSVAEDKPMSKQFAVALMVWVAGAVPALAQQAGDPGDPNRPITMSGCVGRSPAPQQPLTFAQDETGFLYRLSGRGLNKFAGQRVEVVGATPRARRFAVRGGLYPSPNVAAQAGAMDPAKAAIARMPGGPESGTGGAELLPEFKVTRIRVVDGSCQ